MTHYENAYNPKEYDSLVEKYVSEGYKVISNNNQKTLLNKHNYGNLKIHVILLICTGIFLLAIPNIIYLLYSYFRKEDDVMILLINTQQQIEIKNNNTNDQSRYDYIKYDNIHDIREFLNNESENTINNESDPEIIVDYLEQEK